MDQLNTSRENWASENRECRMLVLPPGSAVVSAECLVEGVWSDLQSCLDQAQRISAKSKKFFFNFYFFHTHELFKMPQLHKTEFAKIIRRSQIQDLKMFSNPINPSNFPTMGRMPQLSCISNIYKHAWLAGVSSLEPLSGVSGCSLCWWMSHWNLCFVCAFYQRSSGSHHCDWLTQHEVSGERNWSEVTQVTAKE